MGLADFDKGPGMAKHLELRTVPTAKKASKRPKTLVTRTLSTDKGEKRRLFALDANSASFGDDFLYVFKSNVKAARKKSKEHRASHVGPKRDA